MRLIKKKTFKNVINKLQSIDWVFLKRESFYISFLYKKSVLYLIIGQNIILIEIINKC